MRMFTVVEALKNVQEATGEKGVTSVDLPMPPGPHITHLLVVGPPSSNQSRMPLSSRDLRWNPTGALTLYTSISPPPSPSPLPPEGEGLISFCKLQINRTTTSFYGRASRRSQDGFLRPKIERFFWTDFSGEEFRRSITCLQLCSQ